MEFELFVIDIYCLKVHFNHDTSHTCFYFAMCVKITHLSGQDGQKLQVEVLVTASPQTNKAIKGDPFEWKRHSLHVILRKP